MVMRRSGPCSPSPSRSRPEVLLLPDGRAGSYGEDPDGAYFLIFAREGERWLWDGQIQVIASKATPAS